MRMCLMNMLKVGTSGLVSFLCSKPSDGSCYCSSLANVSVESAPFSPLGSHLPLNLPFRPHWPYCSLNIQVRFLCSRCQKRFPQDVWIPSWFSPSTLSIFAQMFLNKPPVTMYFKSACPLRSRPYNPFCHIALLGIFHLHHVVSFNFLFCSLSEFLRQNGGSSRE